MIRLLLFIFAAIFFFGILPAHAQENFKISGELRMSGEGRDNADFNSDRLDGTVKVLNRLRLSFLRKFDHGILIFAQLQDSRIWGEEGSSLASLKAVDLHQAYLEIDRVAGLPFRIRLGRQKLSFGSERLVGSYDWDNIGRAFDALNVQLGNDEQKLNLWLAQTRDHNAPTVARNQEFGGAYFSSSRLLPTTFDAYVLVLYDARNFESVADPAPPGVQDEPSRTLTVYTLGARFNGQLAARFHYDLEVAYQTGQRGFRDISAYALALSAGYTFGARWRPAIHAGYLFGSGDGDPSDGNSETFSNLFPDAHREFGAMDYAGWSNVSAVKLGFAVSPRQHLSIGADWHLLALANAQDAWYRAGGFNVGTPPEFYRRAVPGAGKRLSHELDIYATHVYREHLDLQLGLSKFFAGEFIKNTGGLRADDSIFGYLSIAIRF
jgi:hypothetical protein